MNVIISSGKGMDWNKYLFGSSINREDTIFFNSKYELISNKLIRFIYRLSNTRYGKKIKIFRRIKWFKYFTNFPNENINRLYLFNWDDITFDKNFHQYIMKKSNKIKIHLILTSTYELSRKFIETKFLSCEDLKKIFDKVFTFDQNDSEKYNFIKLPLMYKDLINDKNETKYDLCYVGNSKNRLFKIQKLYKDLSRRGFECNFYVNGVKNKKNRKFDINYNKRISYKKTLEISKESKCILEIIEDGQTHSTTRLCEAIVFEKKLITNNVNLIDDELYSPDFIYILGYRSDSIYEFILNDKNVNFFKLKKNLLSRDLIEITQNYEGDLVEK